MSSMLDSRDLTSIRELVSLFSDLPDSQVKGALCLWKNASYRCSLRRNYNVVRAGMPSLNQKCASPGVFFLIGKEILAPTNSQCVVGLWLRL
jgi:hypothetical protein